MDALKGGMAGAQKGILEAAIKTAEDQGGNMAPGYIKCFFPCCGGPMGTLKKFEFAVPADKKDEFNQAYKSYADAQEKLAKLG